MAKSEHNSLWFGWPPKVTNVLVKLPWRAAMRAWGCVVNAIDIHVLRRPAALEHRRYAHDSAEITFLVDHPLDSSSVVFDVGAHVGNWLARIIQRYDPVIHAFEVHPDFCDVLERRLGRNPKVTIHRCGLGFPPRSEHFIDAGPATRAGGTGLSCADLRSVSCMLEDPAEMIARLAPRGISLLAMNIEGAEYEVLDRIIASGCIARIRNVMVQFHEIDNESSARRDRLREQLSTTHFLTFQYGDFWENWRCRQFADLMP